MSTTRHPVRALAVVGAGALFAGALAASHLSGAPATAAPAPAPAPEGGPAFTVDPVHTNVIFRIKHLGTSDFYGRFNKTTGTFTLGDTLSADITVDAASVDTNNAKRDDHVRGPDFLNAAEFGKITFSAKGLAKSGNGYKGKGELTLHGVTKPVEVEIAAATGKGMQGGEIAGLTTTFTIKRSDFGVKGLVGPVGDDVTLMIGVEGGSK
jgi:polyisoprenoid-binding protein YceI